jgi:hypothetical protein
MNMFDVEGRRHGLMGADLSEALNNSFRQLGLAITDKETKLPNEFKV